MHYYESTDIETIPTEDKIRIGRELDFLWFYENIRLLYFRLLLESFLFDFSFN